MEAGCQGEGCGGTAAVRGPPAEIPRETAFPVGLRALFSNRPNLLRRITLSRALLPAYAFGMLLMAAAIPAYQAAERHWFAQDRLMEITPEAPAFNRYEYEVAKVLREEVRVLLDGRQPPAR